MKDKTEDYSKPTIEIDYSTKSRGKRRRESPDYTDTVKPLPIKDTPRKKKGWENAVYEDTGPVLIYVDRLGEEMTQEELEHWQDELEGGGMWDGTDFGVTDDDK